MSKNRVEKYIEIVHIGKSTSGITDVWCVINRRTNKTCGQIQWYGGFRKYCFFPANDRLLFDSDFLRLIADFLNDQNWQRKKMAKKKG